MAKLYLKKLIEASLDDFPIDFGQNTKSGKEATMALVDILMAAADVEKLPINLKVGTPKTLTTIVDKEMLRSLKIMHDELHHVAFEPLIYQNVENAQKSEDKKSYGLSPIYEDSTNALKLPGKNQKNLPPNLPPPKNLLPPPPPPPRPRQYQSLEQVARPGIQSSSTPTYEGLNNSYLQLVPETSSSYVKSKPDHESFLKRIIPKKKQKIRLIHLKKELNFGFSFTLHKPKKRIFTITNISADSPAQKAGLKEGMILTQILIAGWDVTCFNEDKIRALLEKNIECTLAILQ